MYILTKNSPVGFEIGQNCKVYEIQNLREYEGAEGSEFLQLENYQSLNISFENEYGDIIKSGQGCRSNYHD